VWATLFVLLHVKHIGCLKVNIEHEELLDRYANPVQSTAEDICSEEENCQQQQQQQQQQLVLLDGHRLYELVYDNAIGEVGEFLSLISSSSSSKTTSSAVLNYVNADTQDVAINALHLAAVHGHCEILRMLLEAGADADVVNTMGFTAMHAAARNGHAHCLRLLLASTRRGKEAEMIHAADNNGINALHLAAFWGHEEAMDVLLQAGAVVNAIDNNGLNAAHGAAMGGRDKCLQLLLNHGIDINQADVLGQKPIDLAKGSKCQNLLRAPIPGGIS